MPTEPNIALFEKPVVMFHGGSSSACATFKKRSIAIAFLLAILTAAVYSSMLSNGFAYYDDESYITANTHIQKGLSWSGVKWAFTSIGYSDNWHPLTWVSHMLDVQMFGLNPAGHHFTNLFFHILATLLLYGFLTYTTGKLWPSAFVAALFALHPLHVESVAWAAERKDVLSAVFWFATLWTYAWYARRPTIKSYVLVFILFALGLMAKPMLVTLPFILLLADYWPLERLTLTRGALWRLTAEKLPLLALSVVSSVITVIAQHGAIGSLHQYTFSTRVTNAIISYCVYLGQMFWPMKLSVFYSFPRPQPVPVILCLVSLVAITAMVIWQGKREKYLVTGWFWYLASLVPVIGIMQVGSQPHADRYTYVPLVGIFIMVMWGLHAMDRKMGRLKKLVLNIVLAAVFIGMVIKSREQIGYWKNGVTLFTHGFDVTKGKVNENIYYNFGNLMLAAGRTDDAMSYYQKALEINPNHAKAHINYALLLSNRGRTDEAIAHYLKALEHGTDIEAHNNLGTLFAKMGRTDEATVHFQKALAIDPSYGDAHYNFGFMLANMGRTDEAMAHFQKVVELSPADEGAHFMLGTLLAQTGRIDEAIAHFRKALEINPDAIGPLHNLAFALVQRKQFTDATSIVRNALAAAKSAGDEERAKTIVQILSDIDEAVDSSKGH